MKSNIESMASMPPKHRPGTLISPSRVDGTQAESGGTQFGSHHTQSESESDVAQSEKQGYILEAHEILMMEHGCLEDYLKNLLFHEMPGARFEEYAEDGSLRIPSLVAVWLISRVGHMVGEPKLINLSKIDNTSDLGSITGLARVLWSALNTLQKA